MISVRGIADEDAIAQELEPAPYGEAQTLQLDDLRDVPATVTAELGHCNIYVREILALERGSVLALNKLAGDMADLLVNGVPIARGEVVVLGDSLNVRIAEIFGLTEKEPHEA